MFCSITFCISCEIHLNRWWLTIFQTDFFYLKDIRLWRLLRNLCGIEELYQTIKGIDMLLNLQNAKPNCTLKFDALYLTRLGMYYARKRIHSRVKNKWISVSEDFLRVGRACNTRYQSSCCSVVDCICKRNINQVRNIYRLLLDTYIDIIWYRHRYYLIIWY